MSIDDTKKTPPRGKQDQNREAEVIHMAEAKRVNEAKRAAEADARKVSGVPGRPSVMLRRTSSSAM